MKTPDEIKNGLRTCTNRKISCDGCPYHYQGCAARLAYDAIAYINQLETQLRDAAKLQSERDAWKHRAEAAERDITSMLESCDCEIRHEYCARCYTPNECNTDKCAGYAKWRGPCKENGGAPHAID